MYSKLPNLVLGFHGCSTSTYENVIFKKVLELTIRPRKVIHAGALLWN